MSWLTCGLAAAAGALVAFPLSYLSTASLPTNNGRVDIRLELLSIAFFTLPLVALFLFGGPLRRGFAVGGTAVVLVTVLSVARPESSPIANAEGELREIAMTSTTPLYYLGRSYGGDPLYDVSMLPPGADIEDVRDRKLDSGDQMFVDYGESCSDFGCTSKSVLGEWLNTGQPRIRCLYRYPTARGATPIRDDASEALLYTGDLVISLPYTRADRVRESVLALRQVGLPHAENADLPPPSPRIERQIMACPLKGSSGKRPAGP